MRNNLTRHDLVEEIYAEDLVFEVADETYTMQVIDVVGFEMMLKALDEQDVEALRNRKVYKKDFDYMIQAVEDFSEMVFEMRIALENRPQLAAGLLKGYKEARRTNTLIKKAWTTCYTVFKQIEERGEVA